MKVDKEMVGKRIRIISMNDPSPVPSGSEGIITHVDGLNQYHVKWDCGRTLAVIPGVDNFVTFDLDKSF